MEFIAIDLIGEFHPPSSKGNRYALTAVCMLTGFTFCILIKSKKAEDVMKAFTDNICCVFRPSKKILTDNGTEFRNKLWTDVFKRMRTEHRTSPIYSPQCNGRIKGFHKLSQTSALEDRRTEERQRAIQAVRDITTGQPTPTLEENQMYDWDGQFDEMLGLPIQLRNRVSNPGTPPVRASPRVPASGGVP